MYICVCKAITGQEIERLLNSGADTLEQIQTHCQAGSDCGSCLERLKGILSKKPTEPVKNQAG